MQKIINYISFFINSIIYFVFNINNKKFQKRVEMNLIFKNNNHLTAVHDTTCLVVVDDLNLAME
jgi:hypothetical protein